MSDLISIHKYNIETIPEEGWIKLCYSCNQYTAHFFIINNDKYYLCKKCKKRKFHYKLFIKYKKIDFYRFSDDTD